MFKEIFKRIEAWVCATKTSAFCRVNIKYGKGDDCTV